MRRDKTPAALTSVVLLHLAVTLAHGSAHAAAGVQQGPAALVFVFAVIIAGPLVGLAWMRADRRAGAGLIAVTMSAALLFGLINHFLVPGADRVGSIVESSRALFDTSAVMLVMTEAAAAVLAVACVRDASRVAKLNHYRTRARG